MPSTDPLPLQIFDLALVAGMIACLAITLAALIAYFVWCALTANGLRPMPRWVRRLAGRLPRTLIDGDARSPQQKAQQQER